MFLPKLLSKLGTNSSTKISGNSCHQITQPAQSPTIANHLSAWKAGRRQNVRQKGVKYLKVTGPTITVLSFFFFSSGTLWPTWKETHVESLHWGFNNVCYTWRSSTSRTVEKVTVTDTRAYFQLFATVLGKEKRGKFPVHLLPTTESINFIIRIQLCLE